jgi:hypothetical protein
MNTSNGSIRATSRTSGGARTKNLAEKIAALGEKRGRYQALLAQLAEDPWAHEKTPDRLRATNGPIEDIRKYLRAGNPYYQPSAIIVPVLLPHGEWDSDVPIKLGSPISVSFNRRLIADGLKSLTRKELSGFSHL